MKLPTKQSKFRLSHSRIAVILVILHLAAALPLAYVLNIWMDEASTLYTTGNGFFSAFQNVLNDEKQAPLYFLILGLWRSASDSIFFARLFSVLCAAAAVKFFYELALLFAAEKRAAFFAAFFFAAHPFLVWASVEIRVYSLVILLSVLLLKFFAEGYLKIDADLSAAETKTRISPKKARIAYTLLAVVALYTNYYLGFLLAGGFAALIAARRFRQARTYFLQMLVVGACFLPLAIVFRHQFTVNAGGYVAEKSLAEALQIWTANVQALIFPMGFSAGSFRQMSVISAVRLVFLGAVSGAIVILLVKNHFRQISENVLIAGTIAATVAVFLLAAYFLLSADYVAMRHFAVLFTPLLLFLTALLTEVLPRRRWMVFAVALALLFPFTKIYKQFPNFAKRGDWARVAKFIEANEKPNQPIIVFKTYDALSLPFYYKGVNRILPDEKFFDWAIWEAAPKSENAFRRQIDFVISKIPADAPEIWLATEEICQDERTRAACRPLENFVEANYTVVKTQDFYQERVRLLRRKTR